MKDKYKWEDADICLRCEETFATPKGNGLRYCVCEKCSEDLRKNMENYKKNGLYCTRKR